MLLFMLKLIAWCMIGALLIFVGAVSGLFFRLWPTLAKGEAIRTDALSLRQLENIRAQDHFAPTTLNAGVIDFNRRAFLSEKLIDYIETLRRDAPKAPTLFYLLSQTKGFLASLGQCDPIEKERVADCLRTVFLALGQQNSRGLISVWQYGLPNLLAVVQKASPSANLH